MRAKDALGRYGEDIAVEHLRRQGLTILARNWRCRPASSTSSHVTAARWSCARSRPGAVAHSAIPLEAVSPRKLRRLRGLALRWLDEQGIHVPDIRFDVIGIVQPPAGPPLLEHLRGVS